MVIVLQSHILESVHFPLPEMLIIWFDSCKPLDAIPVFEAWETQSGVCILQQVAVVPLHYPLLDLTLDKYVLCMHHKWVAVIVLEVHLKDTLSVTFAWPSDVIAQQSAGVVVCFHLRQWRWWWLRLQVCNVFDVFNLRKHIQVLD
jgi:hypothetical protein